MVSCGWCETLTSQMLNYLFMGYSYLLSLTNNIKMFIDVQNWKGPALASDWSMQQFSHAKNLQYSNFFFFFFFFFTYQYRLSHDYNHNTVIPLISSCLKVKFVISAPSVQSDWKGLVLQEWYIFVGQRRSSHHPESLDKSRWVFYCHLDYCRK